MGWIIKVRNLSKKYGSFEVVKKNSSFEVESGSLFAFLGQIRQVNQQRLTPILHSLPKIQVK